MKRIWLPFLFVVFACDDRPQRVPPALDAAHYDAADASSDRSPSDADDVSVDLVGDVLNDIAGDVVADLPRGPSNAVAVSDATTSFGELGAIVDVANTENALPFLTASYHLGDPTLHYLHVDAELENGQLILSRDEDSLIEGESVLISGNVVALDPSRFRVQCARFQTGFLSARINFETVDPAKTFINFWSKVSTGSNNKSVAFFSARFDTPEQVYLERIGPAGTAIGHTCVTESVNDSFAVQHLASNIGVGETEVSVPIAPVDLSRSLLFASHQATRHESKPGYSQISCELLVDEVRCERTQIEDEIFDLRLQVITFADRTDVSRHAVTIPDGVAEVSLDLPLRGDESVVLGPIGVLGEVATDAITKPDVPASLVEAVLEDGRVVFRRGEPMTGTVHFYPQIVSW